MSDQDRTADASNEDHYGWWVENSPTDHSHHVVHGTKSSIEALRQRVEELERERDAMVEEAVDEQTRSIKAVLMDELHDHALALNDSLAGIVRGLEAERDFLRQSMQRVAEAVGIEDPIQLIAKAENNEETYTDILVKHIMAERDTLRAEIARRDRVAHVNASWRPDR